jgi:hypothetical protein
MNVQVKYRLACRRVYINPYVEPIGGIPLRYRCPRDLNSLRDRSLLLGTCVEPRRYVPPGNHQRVPVGHREGIPQAANQVILVKNSVLRRIVEWAVHAGTPIYLPKFSRA